MNKKGQVDRQLDRREMVMQTDQQGNNYSVGKYSNMLMLSRTLAKRA